MAGPVDTDGFSISRGVLDMPAVVMLRDALDDIQPERAGVRNIAERVTAVRDLATSKITRALVGPQLGAHAFLVRSIFFDKTVAANWAVSWHQDLTIAVQTRADVPGFGPWSEKNGTPHVQPPVAILEKMLTLRFHLDDTGETNGALLVLPATHLLGRLSQKQIDGLVATQTPVLCRANAGDVLLMRPLLLHASRKATRPARRRVIHLEFAAAELPPPLRWA